MFGIFHSPLHTTVGLELFNATKFIINNKFEICDEGSISTPLHLAAYDGLTETYKLIMDTVTDKNPYPTIKIGLGNGNMARTPLHVAAEEGHVDICQLIMDNIPDKNPACIQGWTPLHSAAEGGQIETCRLILENVTEKNPIIILVILYYMQLLEVAILKFINSSWTM